MSFAARPLSGVSFPHGDSRLSSPRAARPHSASLGKCAAIQAQFATASCQLTPVTGQLGWFRWGW